MLFEAHVPARKFKETNVENFASKDPSDSNRQSLSIKEKEVVEQSEFMHKLR